MLTIYHNPRCSKSRQALALLTDSGLEFRTRLYLKNPLTVDELSTLFELLSLKPLAAMRIKEDIISEQNIHLADMSDAELIHLIAKHPILLERPIVTNETSAQIGRPPENILSLLK